MPKDSQVGLDEFLNMDELLDEAMAEASARHLVYRMESVDIDILRRHFPHLTQTPTLLDHPSGAGHVTSAGVDVDARAADEVRVLLSCDEDFPFWHGTISELPAANRWIGHLSSETEMFVTRSLPISQLVGGKLEGTPFEWIGRDLFISVRDESLRVDVDLSDEWTQDDECTLPLKVCVKIGDQEFVASLDPDNPSTAIRLDSQTMNKVERAIGLSQSDARTSQI